MKAKAKVLEINLEKWCFAILNPFILIARLDHMEPLPSHASYGLSSKQKNKGDHDQDHGKEKKARWSSKAVAFERRK